MSNAKTLARRGIIAAIVFWSLILLLLLFLNAMARLEPIEGDGWFAASGLRSHGWSIKEIVRSLHFYHENGNPRIGIFFWLLSYHPSWPIHQVMTPAALAFLFITMFTVALGRRPYPTNARDSYLLFVLVALCWLVTPNVGQTFFYRPITTNYVFGFLCTIAFFIPFRLNLTSGFGSGRLWWVLVAIMPMFGLFVGMCNEHTGPTAILVSVGFTAFALIKKKIKPFAWFCTGSVGLTIGYLMLFFAPGQNKRYDGLGNGPLFETLASRGWTGNWEIAWAFLRGVDALFVFICGLLLMFALLVGRRSNDGLVPKSRYVEVAAFVFFSILVLTTSLVAPISIWRLTIASAFLLLMATLIIVDIFSINWKLIASISLLALIVHVTFAYRSITLYSDINQAFQDRISRIKTVGPKGVAYLPVYPYPTSPMYWGDSLAIGGNAVRAMARYFGVRGIRKLR